MKFHAILDGGSNTKPQKIMNALTGLGFSVEPPSDGLRPFPEPVVIFWSRGLVLSEHIDAAALTALAASGRLISVLVEKRRLPDDLPKHPVVDLIGWRSSVRNAFFRDLRFGLEAASQQLPPPPPKGPMVRLVRRLCGGLTLGVVATFVFGFALNLLGLQNNLCSINFSQPHVSDFCGRFGLGDKPKREARLAWEGREPHSCEAVRQFMDDFPTSPLHRTAAEILDKKRIVVEETWVEDTHRTIASESITARATATKAQAQEAALANSARIAEASCRAFADTELYRYTGFEIKPESWDCLELSDGHYCGFDGERICVLDRLVRTNKEDCGPVQ